MIKKIKSFVNTYRKKLYNFVSTNRQFISFVVLLNIETSVLVILTLGLKTWGIKTLCFDFAVSILLGSLGYLFKPKKQYAYFQTLLIIVTAICIINAVYFTFYNSFVTVGLIESIGQATTVKNAVFDKLLLEHFVYLLFPIIFYIIHKKLKWHNYFNYVSKIEKNKKNFSTVLLTGIVLFALNIVFLSGTDVSRLVKQWNREYIVERYGIIVYQMNDIIQSAQSRIFSYFGYDDAASKFIEYYSNRDNKNSKNKYTNIYKGKNIVFVHMESIMGMFVDMRINGNEVTPTLNKLTREGLYFDNFYPQISVGTSSDTEFTLSTSLMPALSGTVFVNYFDRDYLSIQKLFKGMNYYTFSMHANNASMWNRASMHKSLGYETFYAKDYYTVKDEDVIGLGLSDHEFFKQIIPYLKDIEEKKTNYIGTIITLTNHTPWDAGDLYGEFDVTTTVKRINPDTNKEETIEDPYLTDTRIGNYIRAAHYADLCLGEFIDSLYENDLFNNTVLVFYGDHDARLASKEYDYLYNYSAEEGRVLTEEDDGYYNYDYYANELNKKTPLIIWTKDKKIKGKVDYYMGMIDVLPTIGNMFGFKSEFALGHDIFNIKNDNVIVFPNGNFLTESIYYNNSKSEYKVLKDSAIIDETYVQKNKKYAEQILELSNDIIVYDLIKNEGDKIENEK